MGNIIIELGDIIVNNLSAECREVVKITLKGVYLTNTDDVIFLTHKQLQEGLSSYNYGLIPNE